MNGLKEMLLAEQLRLEQIVKRTKKQLESVPEGSINYNIKMHIFSKIKMYSFSNN